MERTIEIKGKELLIPIAVETEEHKLEVFSEEQKVFEFLVPSGNVKAYKYDYIAEIEIPEEVGKKLTLKGDFPEDFFAIIEEERVESAKYENRPSVHFTPKYGWINDPNGLVYANNRYHLYFQYNPMNTQWNNMSWGHAISSDLLTWEQLPDVLYPDEHGTMFSGCGISHKGKLYFPYTVAGKTFYQGLAISSDGGRTLKKQPGEFLGVQGKDSRDPKVFWHEETQAFIMVLFLEENDFAIYRSKDMTGWEMTQKFTVEKAWECPDLIKVPVVDEKNVPTGESRWMFWSADGFYYWGEFDGYQFGSSFERNEAFIGNHLYATQSYSGIEDRIVTVSWIRNELVKGDYYNGAMAIPREYTAKYQDGKLRLVQSVVKEFETRLMDCDQIPELGCYLVEIEITKEAVFESTVNGSHIVIDLESGLFTIDSNEYSLPSYVKTQKIQMIVDGHLLEVSFGGMQIGVFGLKSTKNEFCLVRREYGNIEGCGRRDRTCGHYSFKSFK